MQIAPGLYALGDKSGGYVRAYRMDDGNDLTLVDTLLDKKGSLVLEELKHRQGAGGHRAYHSHARAPVSPGRPESLETTNRRACLLA